MKTYMCLTLALLAASILLVQGKTSEDRLVSELLQQLGTTGAIARPIPNSNESEPVQLALGLALLRVSPLISEDLSAELDVWIQMYWKDPRLRWDPANYGGLNNVALPSNLLWIPDVRPFHAGNYVPDRVSPVRVVVRSTSDVIYVLPARLRAPCERLRNGSMRCRPVLGSWVYNGLELNTTLSSNPFSLNEFEPMEKWTVADASVQRVEAYYPCCPESYVSVKYNLVLNPKRNNDEEKRKGDKRRGDDQDDD